GGKGGGRGVGVATRKGDVGVGEFVLPGILATDPAVITAPMRLAKGTITLAEPSATGRGGQKLDAGARGVGLAVGELLVPGALGGKAGDVQVRSAKLGLVEPRVVDTRVGSLDARARGIDVTVGEG